MMMNKKILRVRRYYLTRGRVTPPETRYMLEVFESTRWASVKYRVYHWYDMRIPIKIPGYGRLHRWVGDHGGEDRVFMSNKKPRLRDRFYMWDVSQDLRCYRLSVPIRTIAQVEIEEELWRSLRHHGDDT